MNRFLSISLAALFVFGTAACSSNDYVRARGTAGGPVKVEVMRVSGGVEQPPFAVYEGTAGAVVTAQTTPPHFTFDKSWVQTYPPQAPRAATPDVLDRSVPPPTAPRTGALSVAPDGSVVRSGVVVANPVPGQTWQVENGCAVARGQFGALEPASCPATPASPPEAPSTGWEPQPASGPPSAPNAANTNACAAPKAAPTAGRACGTPVYTGCGGTPGGTRPLPGGTYQGIAPGTGWPCTAPKAPRASGPMKVVLAPVALVACLVKGLLAAGECLVTGGL